MERANARPGVGSEKSARRNLALYPLQKIFNKRVFLPIIPIYYTQYVGFSISEIGMIAGFYALVGILFNVPSGYLADKFGRTRVLRIGAVLLIASTIMYAFFPTKLGVIAGVFLESVGFAFMSGSGESLVHDSLEVLDRTRDYSKVLSRSQSIALLLNAVFVALVPLVYVIDPRATFLLGTVAFLVLFTATLLMRDVLSHQIRPLQWRGLKALRSVFTHKTLFVAVVLFGVIGAIYFAFDIVTIALNKLGISPENLGWVFAAASILGAVIGLFVHHLKRLSLTAYTAVDISVLLSVYIAGWSGSVWALIITAVLSIAFWRYRRIIYQDHLLTRFRNNYKSTMLSVMSTAESLNMLWVPIVTTGVVGLYGVQEGFALIGAGVMVIGTLYIIAMQRAFERSQGVMTRPGIDEGAV